MRRLAVLVCLVLGAGLLSAPPAAAYEPRGGAIFNVPPPWGGRAENYRIVTHVEEAMRQVPKREQTDPTDPSTLGPQPEILITSYLMDRRPTTRALIEACRRGASVRVILDKGIATPSAKDLIAALNGDNRMDRNGDGDVSDPRDQPQTGSCGDGKPEPTPDPEPEPVDPANREPIGEVTDDLPELTDEQARRSLQAPLPNEPSWGGDNSYVTQCKGSCRGKRGSMHTKFYAFSQTGTAKDVVMVSSSNLNVGGATKGWNDLYTMKGVPTQYAGYEQIHDEMGRDRRVSQGYRVVHNEGSPYTSRFFPMANGTKANDPTLNDLKQVRCGSDFGRTKINIAMFYWQGARGHYLLDRVLQLARQKCRVNIVIGAPALDIAKRMRAASRARLITVWDSRHWTPKRVLKVRTHNKYVAIKGTYRGNRSAHVVMTGSQNWGHGSLDKSDDSTINIELPGAYNQYVRHWGQLRKHSIRMAPPR